MESRQQATVEDLYRAEGKAEIVRGQLVLMPLTGGLHGFAALEIAASLREHARHTGRGHAFGDNVGYIINMPQRRSFSPDASFCTQPLTRKFIDGAPIFAAEVRSEEEYGPAAERLMAGKRADYFAAGTLVVWDVDILKDQLVRVYRAADPTAPTIYHRGDMANAEPALLGWSMPVDDLFPN